MTKSNEVNDSVGSDKRSVSMLDLLNDKTKRKIKQNDHFTAAFVLYNESPEEFGQIMISDYRTKKIATEMMHLKINPEQHPVEYAEYMHKIFSRIAHLIERSRKY